MNGGQDLGGIQGFGPVIEEEDEPNFHADWESRVMAMVVAAGALGKWNIDQSRFARENMLPADYMRFPYYRIWYEGLTRLMKTRGMVSVEELASGKSQNTPPDHRGALPRDNVWSALHSLAGSAARPETSKPLFNVGDTVRTINQHPLGHTRLPRYARAKSGEITEVLGHHVFPDSAGNDLGDDAKWLYQVRFSARELWGDQANPRDSVTLDLWEPHFEQA